MVESLLDVHFLLLISQPHHLLIMPILHSVSDAASIFEYIIIAIIKFPLCLWQSLIRQIYNILRKTKKVFNVLSHSALLTLK
jgi:hypothetical protein